MKLEKTTKEDRRVKVLTYEYILPDYEGTLKRVMMSEARVLPCGSSALGGDVTMTGVVAFSMLYLSVDDTLSTLHFEVPYECSFVVDAEAGNIIEDVRLTSFSCLPSGPRRVMAKAEVALTLTKVALVDAPTLTDNEGLMLLHESHTYHTHLYSKREEREYAEELFATEGNEPTVLFSDATVALGESRIMKDGVVVSGICHIRTLLREDDAVRTVNGEIPFEELIPMGEVLPERAAITTLVQTVAFSVGVQKEEGVSRLVANPTLSFFVQLTRENTESFVVDAYSTRHETNLKREMLTLVQEHPLIEHKQRVECRLPKTEGDPLPMKTVLFARSEGTLVECTPDDGVVYLLLKLSHSVAGSDQDAVPAEAQEGDALQVREITYVRQRAESTHAINITTPHSTGNSSYCIHSLLISPPEIYEEEDAFLLCCEVSLTLVLRSEKRLSVVVGAEGMAEEIERERDSFIITYPDMGATIWHLAKAHHASIPSLLELNSTLHVTEEKWNDCSSLSGIKYLLLP